MLQFGYKFPYISCIDDVLPAIKGRDEFVVAERPFGTVINYLVCMADTFPSILCEGEDKELHAIRRECRGIVFDKDGRIMARRFHKFFNLNERPDVSQDGINFNKEHIILEKLDGSMITPIIMPDGVIRWGSKMGITDTSMNAEEFIAKNPDYQIFAQECRDWDLTPIFEWCSRKNRIVVDYPQDKLVLLAIRQNVTGDYFSYDWMRNFANQYHIPSVRFMSSGVEDINKLVEFIKPQENTEGAIIRFNDGHMLKVKNDWYLQLHKCKASLQHEKNVVDLIVNEKIDDLIPGLMQEDADRLKKFQSDFWKGVNCTVADIQSELDKYEGVSRKDFAINAAPGYNGIWRGIMFSAYDGSKNVRDLVLSTIMKSCGSQTSIDRVRGLWGGMEWNYNEEI